MILEPTLSPRFIVYIRNYLLDNGVDPQPVLDKCGINFQEGEENTPPLPLQQIADLFEAAAVATDNSYVGLHTAQNYHYESAPILILAMLAAPSVEEGIRCLLRYDKYAETAIETRFVSDTDPVHFDAGLIGDSGQNLDQLNEYLLAFFVQILKTASRKDVPVTGVWFRHVNQQNKGELEKHFGASVDFGMPDNRLFFRKEYLQEPFITSNNLLFNILTGALETFFAVSPDSQGFTDLVSRELMRLGTEGGLTMGNVATNLAISPRTLRRRLLDEGVTFQELKNLTRERRARYYLSSTSLSLSEIAFQLGFSELSAFSRAFRTQTGDTPQNYRKRIQESFRG
ncbi:MAG: AraC family transcriptional regulator ligand-binding domain-containing protein [Halieaceae bacterium]|nr:AraC family transcriptional regulator ligand-binding domain-containing protein [Halieaceae bacterium]